MKSTQKAITKSNEKTQLGKNTDNYKNAMKKARPKSKQKMQVQTTASEKWCSIVSWIDQICQVLASSYGKTRRKITKTKSRK